MKIIIAGGGTAGHVYPGIAIAQELKRRSTETKILFIGSNLKIEHRLVPESGFNFCGLRFSGWSGKLFSNTTPKFLWEMIIGFWNSWIILRKYRPDLIVVTGGYVSLPIGLAGAILKIPILIHEQNIIPGRTNKMLIPWAKKVAMSFPFEERNGNKFVLTGNPLRREFGEKLDKSEVRKRLKISKTKFTILVFGGSRGAQRINQVISQSLDRFMEDRYQLLWIAGEDYPWVVKEWGGKGWVKVYSYFEGMVMLYKSADLAVCRSGATTIAELTYIGLPAILIPYPYATGGHQTLNAKFLETRGGAIVIKDSELNPSVLMRQIEHLANNRTHLEEMAENTRRCGIVNATSRIVDIICEMVTV